MMCLGHSLSSSRYSDWTSPPVPTWCLLKHSDSFLRPKFTSFPATFLDSSSYHTRLTVKNFWCETDDTLHIHFSPRPPSLGNRLIASPDPTCTVSILNPLSVSLPLFICINSTQNPFSHLERLLNLLSPHPLLMIDQPTTTINNSTFTDSSLYKPSLLLLLKTNFVKIQTLL